MSLVARVGAVPILAFASTARGAEVDRAVFDASGQATADDLAQVVNGDGTWSYALPPGFDPVVRIDRLGRRWRVDAADEAASAAARASAPSDVHLADPRPFALPGGHELPDPAGTMTPWVAYNWNHISCDGDGAFETHTWEGDAQNEVTDPGGHTECQAAGVYLQVNGSWNCSGVSVGQKAVCPAGDDNVCASGEQGFVFGVFAGWNSLLDRFVGPKIPYHRDAMLDYIDD